MAFKVALLAEQSSVLANTIRLQLSERSFQICMLGELPNNDFEDELESLCDRESPELFLSLGFDSMDPDYLSRLRVLTSYASQKGLPLVHCGSYSSLAVFGTDSINEDYELRFVDSELSRVESEIVKLPRHVLLRCSWLIDHGDTSLLASFIPRLLDAQSFRVSDRNYGCPVSRVQIVKTVVAVVQQLAAGAENWGAYQLRSADKCSEAEFIDHLVRAINSVYSNELAAFEVGSSEEFAGILKGNANYSGRRLTDDFGVQMQTWRRGFNATLSEWIASKPEFAGIFIPQTSS